MSSLLALLLEPLDGGVLRSGGSRYDSSSKGSTLTLSGSSYEDREVQIRKLRVAKSRFQTYIQVISTLAIDDCGWIEIKIDIGEIWYGVH